MKFERLDIVIVFSRKTYSLSQKKPIIKWETMPYFNSKTTLRYPQDFEMRFVNAELAGKPIEEEFRRELRLDWSESNSIIEKVQKIIDPSSGLTDIALYIKCLKLAIVVKSHFGASYYIVKANSLDAFKKAVSYGARQDKEVL